MSKDYIFKEVNGDLIFVGDFESLYKEEEEPWEQSGKNSTLSQYYEVARRNIIEQIKNKKKISNVCEIGSGLGYVTNMLDKNFKDIKFEGIDISETAVNKAQKKFPNITFYKQDICSSNFQHPSKYDIVILNQILWYILHDLENVLKNINKIINKNGYIIISMLFLKELRYGKEIISSFDDLVTYCLLNLNKEYKLTYAYIDYSDEDAKYKESILVLKKNV